MTHVFFLHTIWNQWCCPGCWLIGLYSLVYISSSFQFLNGIQNWKHAAVTRSKSKLFIPVSDGIICRADSRFAPCQWETVLLSNDVSHWLGSSLESVLNMWMVLVNAGFRWTNVDLSIRSWPKEYVTVHFYDSALDIDLGPLLLTWINFIPSMDKWFHLFFFKVWDEITYPFPNFNSCTVEVWEWISNFKPHFTGHVITYPCWE